MLGVGGGAGVEAPLERVAALGHAGGAEVIILAVAVPVPAGEELTDVTPLMPGPSAIFGRKIIAVGFLETAVDVLVREQILAEGVVVDIAVVGQGIDFPFPRGCIPDFLRG